MRLILVACVFALFATVFARSSGQQDRAPARLRNGRRSTKCSRSSTGSSRKSRRMVKLRRRGDMSMPGHGQAQGQDQEDRGGRPRPGGQQSGSVPQSDTPAITNTSTSAPSATAQANYEVTSVSSSAAAVAQSSTASSSSSSSGSSYSGQATYFLQNGVAGACGTVHSDSDKIVALMSTMYGNTGAQSQYCGKTVVITNTANSKSVTATVADACPSCATSESLDLSVGAFTAIGDESTGVLDITWYFSD